MIRMAFWVLLGCGARMSAACCAYQRTGGKGSWRVGRARRLSGPRWHVAAMRSGAVGNRILLHFTSQFVYCLLQSTHVFSALVQFVRSSAGPSPHGDEFQDVTCGVLLLSTTRPQCLFGQVSPLQAIWGHSMGAGSWDNQGVRVRHYLRAAQGHLQTKMAQILFLTPKR